MEAGGSKVTPNTHTSVGCYPITADRFHQLFLYDGLHKLTFDKKMSWNWTNNQPAAASCPLSENTFSFRPFFPTYLPSDIFISAHGPFENESPIKGTLFSETTPLTQQSSDGDALSPERSKHKRGHSCLVSMLVTVLLAQTAAGIMIK